jgi:hypothetical protein
VREDDDEAPPTFQDRQLHSNTIAYSVGWNPTVIISAVFARSGYRNR